MKSALQNGVLPRLLELAERQDLLPALATRIDEQPTIKAILSDAERQQLDQALRDNTHHNMQTLMQALKLARTLNCVGITPTFLKGTAQLLTVNNARLGFRKQLDIDLVVAPEDLEKACRVLLTAGYGFYRFPSKVKDEPGEFLDTEEAFRTSTAHHHLPSLVMDGYAMPVELHRHFLPKRFQSRNPLEPLLNTANRHESHGAIFFVPSAEYQIIHTVLGKLVHDGYSARRDFPIREACDYIDLLEQTERKIDPGLVEQHCGENYRVFSQLVTALMAYRDQTMNSSTIDICRRLKLMEKRYNSSVIAQCLDVNARVTHLGQQMLYSPAKLPAFFKRMLGR